MYFIWLVNILLIGAIAYAIGRNQSQEMIRVYWPAFILKISAGVMLGMLYKFYYSEGDTFPYFQDSVKIANLARTNLQQYLVFMWSGDADPAFVSGLSFQQPRAVFLAKAASLFSLVSWNNYWIVASYFSLLCFVASWLLVLEIKEYRKDAVRPAMIGALFFPSIVLWTSGLIKECLAMAALYCIVIVFLKLWQFKRVSGRWWVALAISLWVLWNLKYYYLAVLLPILLTTLVFLLFERKWLTRYSPVIKFLLWMTIFFIPVIAVTFIHPNFNLDRILQVVVENHDAFVLLTPSDELIQYNNLSPTPFSLVANAPKAIFSGLFRPLPWEASNMMQFIAALENVGILILFLTMIYSVWIRSVEKKDNLGWIVILYSVLLCMFLALSTPNFGTLSRYRVGFLPFFIMMLCYDNIFVNWCWSLIQRIFARLVG